MPPAPILDNAVTIGRNTIVMGNVVANFFKKRNINTVSIILDFKNKSLILWGDEPSQISPEDTAMNGKLGIKIYYPSLITYKSKSSGEYKLKRLLTNIKVILGKYINIQNQHYIAKPLNNHAVIIENVNMRSGFEDSRRYFLSLEHNFYIIGKVKLGYDLKAEDLIRKSSIKAPANITTSPTLIKTQSSSITQPKQPKTPSTTQTHIHLASPSAPSQIKNVPEPEINVEKPMSEADIKLENEYKKMILGE